MLPHVLRMAHQFSIFVSALCLESTFCCPKFHGTNCSLTAAYLLVNVPKDDDVVKRRQSGVFRTNCVDCLDRTNVVQGMLGRKALEAFLESLDFLDSGDLLSTAFPKVGRW